MSVNTDESFMCETCHKVFASKPNLRRHQVVHSNEKPFKCELCQRTFLTSYNLKCHQVTHNNIEAPFKCETCNKGFAQKGHLERHLRSDNVHNYSVKLFECQTCHKSFSRKYALKVHATRSRCVVQKKQERPSKTFNFQYCEKYFDTQNDRTEHEKTHQEVKSHSCERCGTSYNQIKDLKEHRRIHPYCHLQRCEECENFIPEEELVVHMISVHNKDKNNLECDICHMTNLTDKTFISHRDTHSGDVKVAIKELMEQKVSPESLKSSLLGEFFLEPAVKSEVSASLFKCQSCNEEFVDENEFNLHISCHIKNELIL